MENKHAKKQKAQFSNTVASIIYGPPSKFDPQGMYTGKPMDESDQPVQDADDL